MFWIPELKIYRWHTRLILMTDKCCICKTQYNTKQFLKCIDVWNRNPNRIQGFLSLIFSCIYWNTVKTTIPTLFSCTLRNLHFLNLYYVKHSPILDWYVSFYQILYLKQSLLLWWQSKIHFSVKKKWWHHHSYYVNYYFVKNDVFKFQNRFFYIPTQKNNFLHF